jgi:NADPH:quinone reductase-like Zn-dependent oxidoreductase
MSNSPADQVNHIPDAMQAVICHGPENYQLEEVAVPRPGPGEALIKVEAEAGTWGGVDQGRGERHLCQ